MLSCFSSPQLEVKEKWVVFHKHLNSFGEAQGVGAKWQPLPLECIRVGLQDFRENPSL